MVDEPMHAKDDPERLIVCWLDESNRFYVTGRTWTVGPDGERFEVLRLSHVGNWTTARTSDDRRQANRGQP